MAKSNEEAMAGCLQCPAHPAVLASIRVNRWTIWTFITSFLCVIICNLAIFWASYTKSANVDQKFEVYVSGQTERLKNIEQCIERNERLLTRIDNALRTTDRGAMPIGEKE